MSAKAIESLGAPAGESEERVTEGASSGGAAPASGRGDTSSAERMAALRHRVRVDGLTPEDAAKEIGVDPIVAQLWLRLPDDLVPGSRRGGDLPSAARVGVAPAVGIQSSGLRRVITCRVPSPAYDRLRSGEVPLLEAAGAALESGLSLPLPETAPGAWRFGRRPLALPVSMAAYQTIEKLAADAFNGDIRDAAGWLIARGVGMALPLPDGASTPVTLSESPEAVVERPAVQPAPQARFVLPPRRRPETRAPLPPDDSAPNGDELRKRREEIGISQRDLAAASGLSRGLVAEIERGRRRHVLTRLRLSETLASLARSK